MTKEIVLMMFEIQKLRTFSIKTVSCKTCSISIIPGRMGVQRGRTGWRPRELQGREHPKS